MSRVPQGSVSGSMLFVIYINDLPDFVTNRVKLYADGSKIFSIINNWEDALVVQIDLDSISKWMNDWGMQLNTKICKVLHYGKGNLNFPYLISDESGNVDPPSIRPILREILE